MSEQTYTRIVQATILIVFVLGTLYADPAAPASAQPPAKHDDRHIADCATLAGIAQTRCERHERMYEKFRLDVVVGDPEDCATSTVYRKPEAGRQRNPTPRAAGRFQRVFVCFLDNAKRGTGVARAKTA